MGARFYLTVVLWTVTLWLAAAVYLAGTSPIKAPDSHTVAPRQAAARSRPTCVEPGVPENGYRSSKSSVFYAGHQISYGCKAGFWLEGNERISCIAYFHDEMMNPIAVRWDADVPQCGKCCGFIVHAVF